MRAVTPLKNADALEEHMAAHTREGGKVYLLLDGARFDDIHAFIYRTDQSPEYIPLYRGTYFESVLEVSPCLALALDEDAPLLRWALREGMAEGKAMLIVADLGLEELAAHFQNFLEAKLPNISEGCPAPQVESVSHGYRSICKDDRYVYTSI